MISLKESLLSKRNINIDDKYSYYLVDNGDQNMQIIKFDKYEEEMVEYYEVFSTEYRTVFHLVEKSIWSDNYEIEDSDIDLSLDLWNEITRYFNMLKKKRRDFNNKVLSKLVRNKPVREFDSLRQLSPKLVNSITSQPEYKNMGFLIKSQEYSRYTTYKLVTNVNDDIINTLYVSCYTTYNDFETSIVVDKGKIEEKLLKSYVNNGHYTLYAIDMSDWRDLYKSIADIKSDIIKYKKELRSKL